MRGEGVVFRASYLRKKKRKKKGSRRSVGCSALRRAAGGRRGGRIRVLACFDFKRGGGGKRGKKKRVEYLLNYLMTVSIVRGGRVWGGSLRRVFLLTPEKKEKKAPNPRLSITWKRKAGRVFGRNFPLEQTGKEKKKKKS